MKTKNLTTKAIRDAILVISDAFYALNTKGSVGYAFDADAEGVTYGEHVWPSEIDRAKREHMGYIDLATHTLTDCQSGETRKLA